MVWETIGDMEKSTVANGVEFNFLKKGSEKASLGETQKSEGVGCAGIWGRGRASWAEGTAIAKAQRLDHASSDCKLARRRMWLE